jgi:hypothetical protein
MWLRVFKPYEPHGSVCGAAYGVWLSGSPVRESHTPSHTTDVYEIWLRTRARPNTCSLPTQALAPVKTEPALNQNPAWGDHWEIEETSGIPANRHFRRAILEYNPGIPPPANSRDRPRLLTRHGHDLDVAVSALQKAIRRSHTDDSLYWGAELLDRYPAYLWRRIKVILSEDIGIAEPHLPATIEALHRTWEQQRKEKGGTGSLPTMHAVILMAKAKKSRMVNHALIAHTTDPEYRDPPDHALDRHTKAGRKLGREMTHFFQEAALLADPETGELSAEGSIPDPYLERARLILDE